MVILRGRGAGGVALLMLWAGGGCRAKTPPELAPAGTNAAPGGAAPAGEASAAPTTASAGEASAAPTSMAAEGGAGPTSAETELAGADASGRPKTPTPLAPSELADVAPLDTPLPLPKRPRLLIESNLACVLSTAGQVHCWGENSGGQVGDGTKTTRPSTKPALVPLTEVADLVITSNFGCALRVDRTLWCWGSGFFGEAYETLLVPRQVLGLPKLRTVGVGMTSVCASSDADVWCWGVNWVGGAPYKPPIIFARTPKPLGAGPVVGLGPITWEGVVMARADGRVELFQTPGKAEILSSNALRQSTSPLVAFRATGHDEALTLTADGVVHYGAHLSRRTKRPADASIQLVERLALPPIMALPNDGALNCALAWGGTLYCWASTHILPGDGSPPPRTLPAPIAGLAGVVSASGIDNMGCAINRRNEVWCWGESQPFLGKYKSSPTKVARF